MFDILVRPHGEVQLLASQADGQDLVTISLPDPTHGRLIGVEFRLADFVAFADYAASISNELLDGRS